MTMNRQVKTDFNAASDQLIELEATQETKFGDKTIPAGGTVRVSKSEAKRLLQTSGKIFRVRMD